MPGILQLRRWYHHRRAECVLISFPKSGRTWLRTMLGRALQQHHGADPKMIMRTSSLRRLDPRIPRIQSTHDDFAHDKTPREIERKRVDAFRQPFGDAGHQGDFGMTTISAARAIPGDPQAWITIRERASAACHRKGISQ